MPKISALTPKNYSQPEDQVAIVDSDSGETKRLQITHIMPVGSIMDFAGTSAPAGWILCYGQALNAVTNPEYQALFDVIGTTYGGSDNTDFVVPDLRGRVVAGRDNMGGVSADRLTDQTGGVDGDTLGDTGGSEVHRNPLDNKGGVPFALNSTRTYVNRNGPTPNPQPSIANYESTTWSGSTAGSISTSLGLTGETDDGNTVQPTIILNKIMKY